MQSRTGYRRSSFYCYCFCYRFCYYYFTIESSPLILTSGTTALCYYCSSIGDPAPPVMMIATICVKPSLHPCSIYHSIHRCITDISLSIPYHTDIRHNSIPCHFVIGSKFEMIAFSFPKAPLIASTIILPASQMYLYQPDTQYVAKCIFLTGISYDEGSSIYYVIIFGGLGRPLPPYVICNHLGLPPPM